MALISNYFYFPYGNLYSNFFIYKKQKHIFIKELLPALCQMLDSPVYTMVEVRNKTCRLLDRPYI